MTLTQEVKRIVPSRLDEKAKKVYNRLKDETDNFDVDVLVIFPELATAVEEFIEVIKKKYPEAIKKTKPAETPPPPPPAPDSDDKEVLEAMRDYRISELKAKRLIELRNEASESKKESIDKMLETLKKSEFYDTRYTSKRNIDKNRTRDVKKDSNRGSLTAKDELNMTGRRFKRISKAGHKNQYGTTEGGKVYYEYRANRRDIDHKIKMAKGDVIKGGGVGNLSSNLKKRLDTANNILKKYGGRELTEREAIRFNIDNNSQSGFDGGRKAFILAKAKFENATKRDYQTIGDALIDISRKMTGVEYDLKEYQIQEILKSKGNKFDNGGRVEGRFKKHFKKGGRIDLFETPDKIPVKIQEILDFYEEDFQDGRYDGLSKALKEVEARGYTFEFYLDGEAYGLRPKNVPLNHIKGYEEYSKGGGVGKYYGGNYLTNKDLKELENWNFIEKDRIRIIPEINEYGTRFGYNVEYLDENGQWEGSYSISAYSKREAFEKLKDKFQGKEYSKGGGVKGYYFEVEKENNKFSVYFYKPNGDLDWGKQGFSSKKEAQTYGEENIKKYQTNYPKPNLNYEAPRYFDDSTFNYDNWRRTDKMAKGDVIEGGGVEGRFKKHFAKGGWVLYDEDTQKEIKTYKTESEARKDLYEYEGNGNIVKKSVWDKSIEPKVDRIMFEEEMYEYERGGLIDADLYYDMLGAVPPLYISELNGEKQMDNNTFAVGEAYDYTDTPDGFKATYQAYSKKGNLFFDEGLIYFTSRGIAKSVEPKIDRFMFEDEMYEYGKGGMINGKYLDNISTAKKQEILTNIARHYGITNAEAEKEVRDSEAEMLYEYISNNPSLRMEIYRGIEK